MNAAPPAAAAAAAGGVHHQASQRDTAEALAGGAMSRQELEEAQAQLRRNAAHLDEVGRLVDGWLVNREVVKSWWLTGLVDAASPDEAWLEGGGWGRAGWSPHTTSILAIRSARAAP